MSSLLLAACLAATACKPTATSATSANASFTPLPDLNTVEECQRADLSRNYGKIFHFHLYDCTAEVSISDTGHILAFKTLVPDACHRVLEACAP